MGESIIDVPNIATGETYGFLATGAGERDVLRLRWSARPGARVAEHIHPRAEERFEVIEGSLLVVVGRDRRTVPAGESATVPPGRRHWFANETDAPVVAQLEVRPGLRMREVFEMLAGMARDGHAGKGGLPRNPLRLAAFAWEFREEIRGPRPPWPVQRAALPPAAALARRVGIRGWDERYAVGR